MRELLAVMKALADPSRLRIVAALRGRELCLCQIVELVGLATSTVSRHMSILEHARLVDARKDGRWAYYRLPEGDDARSFAPLFEWLSEALQGDELIMRDAQVLEEVLARDPEEVARNQRTRTRD